MAKKATVIDSVDALATRIKEMRAAQAEFATFTQEQVDKIFYAAAMAANKARIPLAQMAVEETGMGIMAKSKVFITFDNQLFGLFIVTGFGRLNGFNITAAGCAYTGNYFKGNQF